MEVILPQPPLDTSGYAHRKNVNISADEWSTALLRVSLFNQPSWTPENQITELDLSKVKSLSFVSVMPYTGGSASIEIKEIILFGYDPTYISTNDIQHQVKQMSVATIDANRIKLTVPKAGVYSLEFYTIDGRKISAIADRYFEEGTHSIQWDRNRFASGIYLFRIKGIKRDEVKRTYKFLS